MADFIERLKEFARFGHPYRKTAYITAFMLVVVFIASVLFLLPYADYTSVQAGLTIIAEILGVLLGTVLIVIGLLIDQDHRARELLRRAFPMTHKFLHSKLNLIQGEWGHLIEQVIDGQIQLDEPAYVGPSGAPLPVSYRDHLGNLSALIIALDGNSTEVFY